MDAKLSHAFWSDTDVETKSPLVKLAYLWIRSNSQRTLAGTVIASPRRFAFETGLDMGVLAETVKALPNHLTQVNGVIFIHDFMRKEFGAGASMIANRCFTGVVKVLAEINDRVLFDVMVKFYPELIPILNSLIPSEAHQTSVNSNISQNTTSANTDASQIPLEGVREEKRSVSDEEVKCTVRGESEGELLPSPAPPSPLTPRNYRRARTRDLARDVILPHLVAKTEREYKPVDSNLDLIAARLEEVDLDTEGVKEMIDRQCARWKTDEKMSEYLRVTTLFNKTKFHEYYSARHFPIVQNRQPDHSKGF
jgi:uncharacterized phage protein (TIGR02220 family)